MRITEKGCSGSMRQAAPVQAAPTQTDRTKESEADARINSALGKRLQSRFLICSWHVPKNAIVDRTTGAVVEAPLADRISKYLPKSHGICETCHSDMDDKLDQGLPLKMVNQKPAEETE